MLHHLKISLAFFRERQNEQRRTAPLRNRLLDIITQSGSISFHDFMENALYDPVAGFYVKRVVFGGNPNKPGDFSTMPKKFSPHYGQGIASLLTQLDAANKDKGGIQQIVSIAGGDGTLDRDLLDWLQKHNPALYKTIRYESVEISKRQIEQQKKTLRSHKDKIIFTQQSGIAYLQTHTLHHAFVFSNEWLDAFPVHVISKKGNTWKEVRITKNWRGKFVETKGEVQDEKAIQKFLTYAAKAGRHYESAAYTNYSINANTDMIEVAEALSKALVSGFSLMIDYGAVRGEPMQAIFTFSRDPKLQNVLSYPGSTDMTTQIDWSIWIQASANLTLQSVTFDLILLTYFTSLTKSDIVESLQKQWKFPALLQSAGKYTLSDNLHKKLTKAAQESEMWFTEGMYGALSRSPYPSRSLKTYLFHIKRKFIAGEKIKE